MIWTIYYRNSNPDMWEGCVDTFVSELAASLWLSNIWMHYHGGGRISRGDGWIEVEHPDGSTSTFLVVPVKSSEQFMAEYSTVGQGVKQVDLI